MRTKPQATTLKIGLLGILSASVLGAIALALAAVLLVPAEPAGAAFPGTNGKIAFVSNRDGDSEIWVMNQDGSGPMRLTNNQASDGDPAFSPDGQKIAFTSNRSGNFEIYTMNAANGSNQTNISNNPAFDAGPAWSPDGEKIAFHTNRDGGNYEIYTMEADDGGGLRRITNTQQADDDIQPAWSWTPDGEKITFTEERGGEYEIWVVNPDGTDRINLTKSPAFDGDPNWSPDGERIAFMSRRENEDGTDNRSIFVMDYDGGNQRRLTNMGGGATSDEDPAFSPDGKKIAFESIRSDNSEIYEMNAANGASQTNRTNNPARDGNPDWGPVPGSCTLTGNNGDNELNGTPGNDVICGLGGNDTIRGLDGNDVILGGAGNDILYGGTGSDRVFGEEGDDIRVHTKDGVQGNDLASGGPGSDTCVTDPADEKASCP